MHNPAMYTILYSIQLGGRDRYLLLLLLLFVHIGFAEGADAQNTQISMCCVQKLNGLPAIKWLVQSIKQYTNDREGHGCRLDTPPLPQRIKRI